jgi:hypothetical protein
MHRPLRLHGPAWPSRPSDPSRPSRPGRLPPAALAALLALLLGAAAAAPALATVTIAVDQPLDGDILASPITVVASATTGVANARVTAWHVYVDGVLAYGTPGPTASISATLAMDDGSHELIVRAWDSTGYYDSTSVTVTIGICSGFTVDLQSPVAGSALSPVQFAAVASSCHRITGFAVYVDGQRVYQQPGSTSLDTSLDLPAGHYSVAVRATDSTRATASSDTVPIDIESPVPPAPARPPAKPVQPAKPGQPRPAQPAPPPQPPPPARR